MNLFCNFNIKFKNLSFRPSLVGALITIVLAALCIKLGLWQFHKAEYKLSLQAQYNKYQEGKAEPLPSDFLNLDLIRYKKIYVSGKYLPQYQIFLDNQFDGDRAGYYVITPLEIEGSKAIILINRGWIEASGIHTNIPKVITPTTNQKIEGTIWVPSNKFYTLEKKSKEDEKNKEWKSVWQNMDIAYFSQIVPIKILPIVLRMSPENEGGFARHWVRPDDRIETHLSYGYQWYGFAAASIMIYLYLSFHKDNDKKKK